MRERLLIKNLPPEMSDEDVLALLSPICRAELIEAPHGEGVGRHVVIEVADHGDASRLVEGLDGRLVANRHINVEWLKRVEPPVVLQTVAEEELPETRPRKPPERPHRPERSPGR